MDRLYMRKCVRTFLHGVAIANRVSLKRPTSRRENNLRSPRTTGRGSSEEDPQVRFLLPSSAGRRKARGHPVTHWLPRDADPTRIRLCACAPHPLGTLMGPGEVHSPPKGANLSHKTVRPPTSHAMTPPVRRPCPLRSNCLPVPRPRLRVNGLQTPVNGGEDRDRISAAIASQRRAAHGSQERAAATG